MSNPNLSQADHARLTKRLMTARRAVAAAKTSQDEDAMRKARAAVDRAKRALGERGKPWWRDGAPDFNRRMASNTPYAEWFRDLSAQ